MKLTRHGLRWFVVTAAALGGFPSVLTCAAQQVTVADAWARATVAGQTTAGAYATFTSASDAFLVGAASPFAERVEIHHMSLEGGVMRMRPVERIELPARKAVRLAPGGLHLMLIGVSRPLRAGERLPLALTFESRGGERAKIEVQAEIRSPSAAGAHHH
jgi:copper(I)-binding protein